MSIHLRGVMLALVTVCAAIAVSVEGLAGCAKPNIAEGGYDASLIVVAQLRSMCLGRRQGHGALDDVYSCRQELLDFLKWASIAGVPIVVEPGSPFPLAAFRDDLRRPVMVGRSPLPGHRASAVFQSSASASKSSLLADFFDVELLVQVWGRPPPNLNVCAVKCVATHWMPRATTLRLRSPIVVHRHRCGGGTLREEFTNRFFAAVEPARANGATHVVVPVSFESSHCAVEDDEAVSAFMESSLEFADDFAAVAEDLIVHLTELLKMQGGGYCGMCLPSAAGHRLDELLGDVAATLHAIGVACVAVFVTSDGDGGASVNELQHAWDHKRMVSGKQHATTFVDQNHALQYIESSSSKNALATHRWQRVHDALRRWSPHRLALLQLEVISAASYVFGASEHPVCQHLARRRNLLHGTTFDSSCLSRSVDGDMLPPRTMHDASRGSLVGNSTDTTFDDGCTYLFPSRR